MYSPHAAMGNRGDDKSGDQRIHTMEWIQSAGEVVLGEKRCDRQERGGDGGKNERGCK